MQTARMMKAWSEGIMLIKRRMIKHSLRSDGRRTLDQKLIEQRLDSEEQTINRCRVGRVVAFLDPRQVVVNLVSVDFF